MRQLTMVTSGHGREPGEPPGPDWRLVALRVTSAGLLFAAGAIHLDLYLTGYQTIPTIGWLFLLQVIAAFALGLAVLASGGRFAPAGRLAAAAGAGFALSTLGGYLLSVWIGLFGFREVRTTTGIVAALVDVAAFVVLAALALAPVRPHVDAEGPTDAAPATAVRFPALISPAVTRASGATAAALAVTALVLLGVAEAGSSAPAAGGTGTGLRTTTVGGTTVLTNAKGFTLYSFAPDTPTRSNCSGSCAAYWPPVTGAASADAGLSGRIGTITRTGGSHQLTYNGHPLYTYVGDTSPGQATGNGLNLNGGLWKDVPVSR